MMRKLLFTMALLAGIATLAMAGGQQAETTATGEEIVRLEVLADMQWQSDPMKSEEFEIWNNFAKEDVGVDITYISPPHANYHEKLNVLFASGDLPDIVWDDLLQDRVRSGYIRTLDDFRAMPKYKEVLDRVVPDELWPFVTFGGKTYFLPNPIVEGNRRGDMIRVDWLDNLGLEKPETIEDIKEVFHAFRYDDPDGDGEKNTYAAGFRKDMTWFDGFHGAFDLQSFWWPAYNMPVDDIDGKLELQYTQQKYKEYLAFMRELWADDVFDPNAFLNSGQQHGEMWKTSQIGYWHHYAYNAKANFERQIRELSDPNAVVEWVGGIEGPYGRGSTQDRGSGRFLMITTESANPEKAMDYLMWVLDLPDDVREFLKWGIEGKQHIVRDGQKYHNPHTWAYSNDPAAMIGEAEWFDYTDREPGIARLRSFKFYTHVDDDPEWLQARFGEYGSMVLQENKKVNHPLNTLLLGKPTLAGEKNIPEMRKIVLEHTTKIIVGQEDLDEGFDTMVRQLNNVGLEEMMAARQAWYNENRK